jgi:hypothetical protein
MAFQTAASASIVCGWWNKVRRGKLNEQKKIDMAVSIYIVGHIWKERGRRIFQQEAMPACALPGIIRDDLAMLALADVYTRFCSCRQCWASKCRGL